MLDTDDKVRMYSKINRLRNINKAGAAIYEGRLLLRTSGIFLPAPIAKAFKDGFDMLSFAQVEQQLEFGGRGVREQPKSIELLGAGGELFLSTLESLVRSHDTTRLATQCPTHASRRPARSRSTNKTCFIERDMSG